MHEYPATVRIVQEASAIARKNAHDRVESITLIIGDDAGMVGDSIQMYFDAVAQDTPCQGAVLNIKRIQPQMQCSVCHSRFVRRPFTFDCPDCGGAGKPTSIGKEFYIESVKTV